MMKKIFTLKRKLLVLFIILINVTNYAQNTPFSCVYDAYLFQYNDVYSIDLASGSSYLAAENITPGSINAAAYNPADGFIWGSLSTPAKTIVRIGDDFLTTSFYIDELPTNNRYIGDISAQGVYYLKGGGSTYYKIDLDPNSATYSQHLATESLSQNISIHDWAFNAVDGNLYAVEKNTNILYRINPTTSIVESLGVVPILSGLSYTYGAVYFDASGRFYVSANQTGTIYVIQSVQDLNGSNEMDSNLFAFGPSSASNDGARCPTAPVLQEICDNGIDDDGDGLIDCQDPSCSGYGECDVILPPTSGGNEGGLESNNRLSEQINKRNYNRTKGNYKFNRSKAARVTKSNHYKRKSKNSFELKDFIPLGVINTDETIESSPTDLVAITNATEIYAVDYMKSGVSVASVLALKTDNGVYEHTKYICDRLLGAELISVSTIDINGQQFIKSLIRNTDNTVEFVLSLSAKIVNNNANFEIESHWNLDKYQSDIPFYNFQIWSNSLDDLYLLAKEVIDLLSIEKPILSYKISPPPTVFVRKGKYINGALALEIINTNASENIDFDAGFRITETSDLNKTNKRIGLEKNYITNIKIETGNLFDIGFRIGDGINTPDDIFMSDGPWGVDDSQANTKVIDYVVSANTLDFENTDFPIERNVALEVTTDSYFAVHRALTPRFKPVNLADYNSFNLTAKGTGNVEVTFIKQSIATWEEQFKATIAVTENFEDYVISFSDFKSTNGTELILNDITTIVFTMLSEQGAMVTKRINLENIRFSTSTKVVIPELITKGNALKAAPNPLETISEIYFNTKQIAMVRLVIYNQLGRVVKEIPYTTIVGENKIILKKGRLSTGLYFCKIIGASEDHKVVKLIIN
ncbi:T9SS type A sorting domain-containing protein [Tenacibaculum finnmarkense]|nr:T9SS type A sorting domain-containing protein [Tenacibaculum finnmarkense]MCG8807801.1 T9SS type A sorting domain-containing protein [Tenacibaculum finnmarkense]MCG8818020.1 T9SS type A sorting domain-containing protein [Tenacibaculum finnmarkense]MCG8825915.1 T9SS type A sorting domain-containing protein [Tenacibaculum finnmarkense]